MKKIAQLILACILLTVACTSPKQKEQIVQKPAITIDTSYKEQPITVPVKMLALSPKQVSIKDIYSKLRKRPQVFHIITTKDTIVTCKEGTKLTIPANCFVTADGKEVTGAVKFKTQEFYSKADILLAGLTTLSDGELLETGGMLNIQAYADGKELKLKPEASIQIEMPAKDKKEDMQLFNGVKDKTGNINWVLAEDKISTDIVKEEMPLNIIIDGYRELIERSITVTDSRKKVLVNNSYIHSEVKERRNIYKCDRYSVSFFIHSNGSIQLTKFTRQNNSGIWFTQCSSTKVLTEISKMDFRQNLYIVLDSNVNNFNGYGFLALEMESFTKFVGNNKSFPFKVDISVELGKDERYERYAEMQAEAGSYFDDQIQPYYNNPTNYIFTVAKLGYINCDRFYYDKSPKTTVSVNAGKNAGVNLVFEDISSFLSPDNFGAVRQFSNIPTNKHVTVVAIKKENDSIFLAIKEANTSDKRTIELTYEKVTLEQLKEKMSKLNKG